MLVHRGKLAPAEGDWTGEVVLVEFPDGDAATAWYASPAYQEILPLRTEHSTSMAALLEGVPDGYRAADKIGELLGG